MACNCNKKINDSECNRLISAYKSGKRYIYIIKDKLYLHLVPDGVIDIPRFALSRQMINENGQIEFFLPIEHKCVEQYALINKLI